MCLIAKNGLENKRIFKFFEINEIQIVDTPFNEDPKNTIFFQKVLILGRNSGKFIENGQYQGDLLLRKSGVVNFERK